MLNNIVLTKEDLFDCTGEFLFFQFPKEKKVKNRKLLWNIATKKKTIES